MDSTISDRMSKGTDTNNTKLNHTMHTNVFRVNMFNVVKLGGASFEGVKLSRYTNNHEFISTCASAIKSSWRTLTDQYQNVISVNKLFDGIYFT